MAHPFNLFAIEGLIDEMAAKEGLDPFEFRRQRMALKPKARHVFDAVEKMSDWKSRRPEGRAVGLSVTERSGSLGAGVVVITSYSIHYTKLYEELYQERAGPQSAAARRRAQ